MKVCITPKSENGLTVINNLKHLEKIFKLPALRFTLKPLLRKAVPPQYRRGSVNFSLDSKSDTEIIFSMKETPAGSGAKKKILEAVNKVIYECDGTPEDVNCEVFL